MVVKFDPERLIAKLAGLDRWAQCVFSVSCVEFLNPTYGRFCAIEETGDPGVITGLVERVWQELAQPEPDWFSSEIPDSADLLALIPDQDQDWNEWSACAENCVVAGALLSQLWSTGEVRLAARIAQQAYEAVDWLASSELDFAVMDARKEEEINRAEIVQSELQRQTRTLAVLADARSGDPAVLTVVRDAARAQAIGQT